MVFYLKHEGLFLSLLRYSETTIQAITFKISDVISVAILVSNIARSKLTRFRRNWTKKWKGKGVNKTHPSGIVLVNTDTRTTAGVVTCKNQIYR